MAFLQWGNPLAPSCFSSSQSSELPEAGCLPISKFWIADPGCPFGKESNGLVYSHTSQLILFGAESAFAWLLTSSQRPHGVQVIWEFWCQKTILRRMENVSVTSTLQSWSEQLVGGLCYDLPLTWIPAEAYYFIATPSSSYPRWSECWEQDNPRSITKMLLRSWPAEWPWAKTEERKALVCVPTISLKMSPVTKWLRYPKASQLSSASPLTLHHKTHENSNSPIMNE